MILYDLVSNIQGSQFPLFILILVLAIIALITVRYLLKISAPYFFLGLLGIIVGLIIGSYVSSPLTKLPGSIGTWFPPIVNIFITVAFLDLFLAQGRALKRYLTPIFNSQGARVVDSQNIFVLDTSVLIDGRILKIIDTNIISGVLLVSSLTIRELRRLSDDKDPVNKLKGRRGLDVLSSLKLKSEVEIQIINQGFRKHTDESLVELAIQKQAKLVSNDIALYKVASIAGLKVISIDALAESLKPMLLPGEEFEIHIVAGGKGKSQGVGYLSDGTMVVVNNAVKDVNQDIRVRVEKIHQTTGGNIIFAEKILPDY